MNVHISKPDISIVIPGINVEAWENLYTTFQDCVKPYTFEMIFVGPHFPISSLEDKFNVKFIRDFGSPSRAFQIGTIYAEAPLLTWGVDDGIFLSDALAEPIKLMHEDINEKRITNLIYTEGPAYRWGQDPRMTIPYQWYRPKFHEGLRLDGIEDSWWTSLLFIIRTNYFRKLGGIDCAFEHTNHNLHDLMFRAQRDGAELVFSNPAQPYHRLSSDEAVPYKRTEETCPIIAAQTYNDYPLFTSIYSSKDSVAQRPIHINYDNWRLADSVWQRKWNK